MQSLHGAALDSLRVGIVVIVGHLPQISQRLEEGENARRRLHLDGAALEEAQGPLDRLKGSAQRHYPSIEHGRRILGTESSVRRL